ncbi:MAG: hypothetical protein PHG08_00065 [Bacilli bacterium]|nr:hypothetical protein [Bacilli bacterium]
MKVYISKHNGHWFSPYEILNCLLFWKSDYDAYDHLLPEWANKISDCLEWILNKLNPKYDYVKIDPWDTWNMDMTLGKIILPMLKQLKATQHGYANVADEDVPDSIKSMNAPRVENEWDLDDFSALRWEYAINEMIWAFEQIQIDNDDQFFTYDTFNKFAYDEHQNRINNGLRLFGKYYQHLWD